MGNNRDEIVWVLLAFTTLHLVWLAFKLVFQVVWHSVVYIVETIKLNINVRR